VGGRHRRHLLRLLAGTVTAHPAALVAGRLVPDGTSPGGPGGPDLPSVLPQLALVAAIVGAVSFGDRLIALLTAVFITAAERCARLHPRTPARRGPRRATRPARLRERHGPGALMRRGPPPRPSPGDRPLTAR
jgi:hypothetical protein